MENAAGTTPLGRVRVFVAYDYPIFLETLQQLLEGEPWIELVGTAAPTAGLVNNAAIAWPHVIIMDPRWQPGLADLTARLRERLPGVSIVVLLLDESTVVRRLALSVNADAFVVKERLVDDLLPVIRRLANRD